MEAFDRRIGSYFCLVFWYSFGYVGMAVRRLFLLLNRTIFVCRRAYALMGVTGALGGSKVYRSIVILFAVIGMIACCNCQIQAIQERTFVSGNYYFMLGSDKCGYLKSVDGGAISGEIVNEPAGQTYFVKKHIGQPKYEDISVQFGFSMGTPVFKWIAESWNGNYEKKSGKVITLDHQFAPKSEKQFTNAVISETTFPACDSTSKQPAYITLTISPEHMQNVITTDTQNIGVYGKDEQKIWLPSNFRLSIDGLDCTRVNKIDSFTVKQTHVVDDIGDARDNAKVPGKINFPNLKITLAESTAANWAAWLESFVIQGNNDESQEKNGTLIFLGSNQQTELLRINFFNLGIHRLVADKAEANADQIKRVTAELYCERMEIDVSRMNTASGAGTAQDQTSATDQAPQPEGKCLFGQTYSIKKSQPANFTLVSADYSVAPVTIAKECFTAKADEKLMVLHFTVENPGNTAMMVRHDSLRILAIDDAQVNRLQKIVWGLEKNKGQAAFNLAPKQKVSLYNVIVVPAQGEPSSIVVKSNKDNDGPDLVYDVHGNIPPLALPFVDKDDPTGATALQEVRAERGIFYPCDMFAVKVEDMSYKTTALGQTKLNEGDRILVCTLLMKNHTPTEHNLRHDVIQPVLSTEEGESMKYRGMLLEETDRPVAQMVLPGNEMQVRIMFLVPKGAVPNQLMIQENKSRRYFYEVPK